MGRELCSGRWSTGLASQEALLWGGCQPFLSLSLIWVFDGLWLARIDHTFKDHPSQPWPVKMAFHWKSETIPLRQCLWLELNTLPTMCRIIQTKYALWKNMHAGGCHQYSKFQTASSSPTVKSVWRRNMKCNVVELHFNLNPSSWDWQDHTMTSILFCEIQIKP